MSLRRSTLDSWFLVGLDPYCRTDTRWLVPIYFFSSIALWNVAYHPISGPLVATLAAIPAAATKPAGGTSSRVAIRVQLFFLYLEKRAKLRDRCVTAGDKYGEVVYFPCTRDKQSSFETPIDCYALTFK